MKLSKMNWLLAVGAVGLLASNVACGGGTEGTGMAGTSGAGTTGSGGSTGGTGGGQTPRVSYTFNTDKEGWGLSTYVDTNYTNLGAATDPDSGVSLDGGMIPTLEWNSTDGDPSPGSIKVSCTFTGFKQYVDPGINLMTDADLSGTHNYVRARIRLVSGTFPSGGVQFHISTGRSGPSSYVYGSAPFINSSSLALGTWITITLDTSTIPQPTDGRKFDPTMVVQIGVQFTTGDPYEGGVPAFGPAAFEIDTVQG